MLRFTLQPQWRIEREAGDTLDVSALLALLAAVQDGGSIAQAGRELGLSYRKAWGLVGEGERLLGQPLVSRERGRGSLLTETGQRLVWTDARINARLQPLLASLGSEMGGELAGTQRRTRPVCRLHASHGFAVAALHELLTARRVPIDLRYRNSLEAVAALARGECDLAGFHVPLGELQHEAAQRYLQWLKPERHRLVLLAVRTQGLFLAPGNPLGVRGLADLTRAGVLFVNRPEGSGTRMLTELLLRRHGIAPAAISGYNTTELTHAAVAAFVASGMADVGLGVQTAAQRFGLHFIPLLRERYFFAVSADAQVQPDVLPVLGVLQSTAFRARVAALSGYDASGTGTALGLDEVFPG